MELPDPQNRLLSNPEESREDIPSFMLDTLGIKSLLERVINNDVRYVIKNQNGIPVAVIAPIVDHHMLIKYLQHEVDPCKWVEMNNDVREELGIKPIGWEE